jgi:acyl carrier protein
MMTKREFLSLFEEILEAEPGSLTGNDVLPGRAGWDSLAVVSLIAMVDEQFGVTLVPREIARAESVADIMVMLGDKITA